MRSQTLFSSNPDFGNIGYQVIPLKVYLGDGWWRIEREYRPVGCYLD